MEIIVSDACGHGSYLSYLYNQLSAELLRLHGKARLSFGERPELRMEIPAAGPRFNRMLASEIAEIIGVGYKYEFLKRSLNVCLSKRETKLLRAALIAADYESDAAFIRRKIGESGEYAIDGIYHFRLKALREKWLKIVGYVPSGFTTEDFGRFCEFLVGESRNKVYLRGNVVFGENFTPLRRSRLTGEEDLETELLLSDAGFVYCIGEVEEGVGDFLQKYYAERAIFS